MFYSLNMYSTFLIFKLVTFNKTFNILKKTEAARLGVCVCVCAQYSEKDQSALFVRVVCVCVCV